MKNLVIVKLLVCVLFCSVIGVANAQESNKDIKVLYVGYNPEKPKPENYGRVFGGAPERLEKDYQTRWPAFKAYLEEHFTSVTCVDPRDYKQEMSSKVDVTIFDELTTPIKEEVKEYDTNGKLVKYAKSEYLTSDYKNATIFIGKCAPDLGRSLGSKLDWHCYCLEGDAQSLQTQHPIFNTPNKVTPTMVMNPTPKNWLHYDSSLPKQMKMWKVQKLSAKNSDYVLGMVSRGAGFLDSPDTEYICGAECKSIESVALGRHGNLFLWGFSGSPDIMTEEAKDVFFNTIVYMKQFNGAGLIAKKMDETIIIRDPYLDYRKSKITLENFETYKVDWLKYNEKSIARADELKKQKAEGKKLSRIQEMFLSKQKSVPTIEIWMEENVGEEAFNAVGSDIKAYYTWIEENREFFYCIHTKDFRHVLSVDKDLKQLAVSNRKIEVLEKCIGLISKGEQTDIANRVLRKYTMEDFKTAKEWKKWLKKNRSKLFFTEAGGYKWLINTLN
ncbi:hypothetical protein BZG02_07800 [Labilibaculum filiforme]|uniref:Uncharacterized protein n=1 Tax=Labilibaculum filiforme TaxID=1940526 RepID=A0A2N3I0Q2_9BACT|nr:hypothetical protein [Labilibaculum filiforme]PKQ63905.1 hypothetical protein BZG02_07800 [Labilibaculum filiforme]